MTISVNASGLPAIQQPTAFLDLLVAQGGSFNAPVAPIVKDIHFTELVLSPHATLIDALASGGGAHCCCVVLHSDTANDLGLVAPGSGLTLTVKRGEARIGGIVQVSADTTLGLPALPGTARIWIWLQQHGGLLAMTTTAAPSTLSCLLGSVVTMGGNILSVDTSGVMYFDGATLTRSSADPGIPTDTPPANLRFTNVTPFGSFDWDGSVYRQNYIPNVAADPTSLAQGMIWFRTDTLQLSVYTAGAVQHFSVGSGGGSGVPASTVQDVGAADAVGTSTNFAREDHVHKGVHKINGGADAFGDVVFTGSAVSQTGNTFTFSGSAGTPGSTVQDVGAAGIVGTSTNYARQDHVHKGVHKLIGTADAFGDVVLTGPGVSQSGNTFSFTGGPAPATSVAGVAGTGTAGSLTTYAREDHQHAGVASLTGPAATVQGSLTLTGSGVSQSGTVFTFAGGPNAAASVTDVTAAGAVGTLPTFAREDHSHKGVHKINGGSDAFGDVVFAGAGVSQSGNTFTFSGTGSGATSVTDIAAAAVVGTSTNYARQDHVHKGVHKITGTSDVFGDVVFTGAGVSQSGNTFTFAGASTTPIPVTVLSITSATAAIGWATPSALTEFLGTNIQRAYTDLTNATSAQLILVVPLAASAPISAPTVFAQYSTDNGVTWHYLDGGTGPSVGYAVGTNNSGWVTLASGAKAPVLLRIVASGGDGSFSDSYGAIYLQVK